MTKGHLDLKEISRLEQEIDKEFHGVYVWDCSSKEEKQKADEAMRKILRERKRNKTNDHKNE